MNQESYGELEIRAFIASGALPLKDATVRIRGAGEDNSYVQHSLLTDNDGLTPTVSLYAPSRELSMSPNPSITPYSVYDIEISAEGYYTKRIGNVPIFAGSKAILPVEMVPASYKDDGTLIPQSNLDSTVYENENL